MVPPATQIGPPSAGHGPYTARFWAFARRRTTKRNNEAGMARTRLRTLIVDDEPVARQVLAEELAADPSIELVGEAANGDTAIRQIDALAPDLVLLDIQMPAKDGFQVVRSLTGPLPAIIFVTAYSEHALRAFEVGAVDYLLKPIAAERMQRALARARQARQAPLLSAERIAKTLSAEAGPAKPPTRIVGRRGHDFYLLDLDEIFAHVLLSVAQSKTSFHILASVCKSVNAAEAIAGSGSINEAACNGHENRDGIMLRRREATREMER